MDQSRTSRSSSSPGLAANHCPFMVFVWRCIALHRRKWLGRLWSHLCNSLCICVMLKAAVAVNHSYPVARGLRGLVQVPPDCLAAWLPSTQYSVGDPTRQPTMSLRKKSAIQLWSNRWWNGAPINCWHRLRVDHSEWSMIDKKCQGFYGAKWRLFPGPHCLITI